MQGGDASQLNLVERHTHTRIARHARHHIDDTVLVPLWRAHCCLHNAVRAHRASSVARYKWRQTRASPPPHRRRSAEVNECVFELDAAITIRCGTSSCTAPCASYTGSASAWRPLCTSAVSSAWRILRLPPTSPSFPYKSMMAECRNCADALDR